MLFHRAAVRGRRLVASPDTTRAVAVTCGHVWLGGGRAAAEASRWFGAPPCAEVTVRRDLRLAGDLGRRVGTAAGPDVARRRDLRRRARTIFGGSRPSKPPERLAAARLAAPLVAGVGGLGGAPRAEVCAGE
ncbi:MAG: hypothetical protein ACRDSK_07825 [Actinophytocola sp.]|uniref:hypothetical protein n=1 Tax=Actinophytocola sp. TaxID=1872138 RepID=UPI003D6B73B9